MNPYKPHRFYCVTCGCALFIVEEINRSECESCVYWLDRVLNWWFHSRKSGR